MTWTMRTMEKKAQEMRSMGIGRRLIFEFLLSCYEGAAYTWGCHDPRASDCSGTLRGVLETMCSSMPRETADGFFRRYFTLPVHYEGAISAMFFLDRNGRAVHVAPYAGCSLFMNCSRAEPGALASFRTEDELRLMYPALRMAARSLDEGRLVWK